MNFFERRNQNKEEKIIKDLRRNIHVDEKKIVKAFFKSVNKENFIIQCSSATKYQLPQSLENAIINLALKDRTFLLMTCPLIYRNLRNRSALDNLFLSLETKDFVAFPKILTLLDKEKQFEILNSIELSEITPNVLSNVNVEIRAKFLSQVPIQNISSSLFNTLSNEDRKKFIGEWIKTEDIPIEQIQKIVPQNYINQIIMQITEENFRNLNKVVLRCVSGEEASNFILFGQLMYSINDFVDEEKQKIITLYKEDSLFRDYILFRKNNIHEYKTDTNNNKIAINEILEEYLENKELISKVLLNNYEDIDNDNKKMKLFLKCYLSENDNSLKITTIEELMQYPNRKLNMKQNCIKNGNKKEIINIITQTLTGLSNVEYTAYNEMFLKNHDIDVILRGTEDGENKLKYLTVISELLNLVDTMDQEQIQEFALNLCERAYSELISGDGALLEIRNEFGEFLNGIKKEYGKEINQSLGFSIKNTELIEHNGKNINFHTIGGAFKLLVHRTNEMISDYDGFRSFSLNSEGYYERINLVGHQGKITFLFDYVPEELLFASGPQDLGTDHHSDELSNFATTENTILKAKPIIDGHNIFKNTEQAYYAQGFSKKGFIDHKPIGIGIYEGIPDEYTLNIAAQYGLDIIRIPDMQENLQEMLDSGIITTGLVKGFKGNGYQILEVLQQKSGLTKSEMLALQSLKNREDMQGFLKQIDSLIEKNSQLIDNQDILNLVDDITLSEIQGISVETRKIYELIKNPKINPIR